MTTILCYYPYHYKAEKCVLSRMIKKNDYIASFLSSSVPVNFNSRSDHEVNAAIYEHKI